MRSDAPFQMRFFVQNYIPDDISHRRHLQRNLLSMFLRIQSALARIFCQRHLLTNSLGLYERMRNRIHERRVLRLSRSTDRASG